MNRVAIVRPDEGETVQLGSTTMRILEDGGTTGHRLGIGEITVAPHTEGPPQHRHARHDEGFYVVSGTARFTVGETSYDVPAGTLAMIPPGAPHTFANPGDEPLVLLNTFTPDLYVQYFRDLKEMIESGAEFTPEATVDVMKRYATEPATEYADGARLLSLGDVPLTVAERGEGDPVLLLHGGAGPDSVSGFAELLAGSRRTLTPVHPGFGGTPRPERLDSIRELAEVYARLLAELDLEKVTVVGSSIGGWIAAELALVAGERMKALVLLDAAGLESAEHPAADFFSLAFDQVIELSYADPDAHRVDLSALTDEQKRIAAGNREALSVYGGASMSDPTLKERLAGVSVPTLVVWGEADRMMTPDYGREFAGAIPGARFHMVEHAGHLPQIEAPGALLEVFEEFVSEA
ncbi:alpha/beta fold hydrolase [Actinomadura napierensis]|uniref:Rhodanese domain-containing protein n=1 Tax=Actinomadura napierensis TaxID=267854 RepID=A0ABN2ZLZ3_9ACTN